MSDTYTKLFSSITESTVWGESYATRIVWVTMLAMADARGNVYGAVPGLARRANVTLEETEKALAAFLAPDPYSRTRDEDGRRIEEIDGGWRLINHAKYGAVRGADERREYKREWDRKNRPSGHDRAKQSDSSPTQSDDSPTKPDSPAPPTPTPTPEDQEQKKARKRATTPPKPGDVDESTWADWLTLRKAKRAPVTETVLREAEREAGKAGLPLTRFLEIWCARGSQGLQADWLKPNELAGARAGPTAARPMGKQEQGLRALEAMKSGNRVAAGRASDGVPEALLLGTGTHAGG